jgi:hypothetical protein
MASPHDQWPDPRAGVTECCSLLAGHREITGGGAPSIEEAGAEGLSFELLNRSVDQPRQIRCHLAHRRWSKIGLRAPCTRPGQSGMSVDEPPSLPRTRDPGIFSGNTARVYYFDARLTVPNQNG